MKLTQAIENMRNAALAAEMSRAAGNWPEMRAQLVVAQVAQQEAARLAKSAEVDAMREEVAI